MGLTMAGVLRSPGYQAVADICSALGVRHRVEHGGKHPKVVFSVNGRNFKIVVSGSASDVRTYYNSRTAVLRILRRADIEVPRIP